MELTCRRGALGPVILAIALICITYVASMHLWDPLVVMCAVRGISERTQLSSLCQSFASFNAVDPAFSLSPSLPLDLSV